MTGPETDDHLIISIASQLSPIGVRGEPDLKLYAEQLAAYLAEQLERFADPRGGDVFLAVTVKRGDKTEGNEYRSGHFVKGDNDDDGSAEGG